MNAFVQVKTVDGELLPAEGPFNDRVEAQLRILEILRVGFVHIPRVLRGDTDLVFIPLHRIAELTIYQRHG